MYTWYMPVLQYTRTGMFLCVNYVTSWSYARLRRKSYHFLPSLLVVLLLGLTAINAREERERLFCQLLASTPVSHTRTSYKVHSTSYYSVHICKVQSMLVALSPLLLVLSSSSSSFHYHIQVQGTTYLVPLYIVLLCTTSTCV